MRWKLEQQETKLDKLFDLVQRVEDDEEQALLAKFLCVRTSGFVESTCRNLINEFTNGTSPIQIRSYVNRETKYITNLRYDRVVALLNSFDSQWKSSFESQVTEEHRTALNSIVSNRNNISHGENDSISFLLMKDYYERVKEIVEILKKIIRK